MGLSQCQPILGQHSSRVGPTQVPNQARPPTLTERWSGLRLSLVRSFTCEPFSQVRGSSVLRSPSHSAMGRDSGTSPATRQGKG